MNQARSQPLPTEAIEHAKHILVKFASEAGDLKNYTIAKFEAEGIKTSIATAIVEFVMHTRSYFDPKDAKSILLWFQKTYPNNEGRKPVRLLKTFGSEWPLKGRDTAGEEMLQIVGTRFNVHNTDNQMEKAFHQGDIAALRAATYCIFQWYQTRRY